MDGFNAVSWKKTAYSGRAPQQVAQRTGEQRCWNSQLAAGNSWSYAG